MLKVDKNHPSTDWIEQIRELYPCEAEIDRVLTSKLVRRGGPAYAPIQLDDVITGTELLLRNRIGGDIKLLRPRWLSGGASKLQMAFDLDWVQPDVGRTCTPMVLRMEPSESIVETSRLREFQAIQAMQGVVPIPPAYWIDATAEYLPYPAIVYGFASGVSKPSNSHSAVTGLGTFIPSALRQPLGHQFVDHLARIHTYDWRTADLSAFEAPKAGTHAVELHLNHWERVWEEDANEDVPLMRLAMAWMRDNMPAVDHISFIHGDYRVGNFLFTEEDIRISAWLDWEMAYLGDRHEDLAWAAKSIFGHYDETGSTFLVGGFMPADEFFAAYEKASGLSVNPQTLKFYEVFNNYRAVAISLASGYRAARNGKTHQDVLLAWLSGISYPNLEELRVQLEELV
ncbi:phosphotransferase family protein [Rhodococcus opacus]|uniref:Phosphotransferase family protein n=1 Tax=Rhodococcus opacus TaxID=37919 RepID=A0AAX3YR73_RHOOP|nr:phosphotransferase family protein [Rhodococcus opacus]MCZ4590302.1 phosphotransferase family protein [Rhodococcus opacus]WLF51590.1 phosphotransferase family protein [Rhodococcus opacus]WLF52613.1 phosphotransferase family protein [Rhodococcus opacus]